MWCGLARLNDITLEATMQCATAVEVRRTRTSCGNGGAKLVHGSGGIVSLRAEQNSAT